MTGVGLGKRGGGGPVPSHQEKASSASVHKRWSSHCAREGFPFTEIGCSTTRGADFSLVSALPQLVTHFSFTCFFTISALEEWGGGRSPTERKQKKKEDKERSWWDHVRGAGLERRSRNRTHKKKHVFFCFFFK